MGRITRRPFLNGVAIFPGVNQLIGVPATVSYSRVMPMLLMPRLLVLLELHFRAVSFFSFDTLDGDKCLSTFFIFDYCGDDLRSFYTMSYHIFRHW